MHVCIFLCMRFGGRVRECKWADEILASCETLRDAVQCQPSLAAPNYEGGFLFLIALYLTAFAAIDNRLCDL